MAFLDILKNKNILWWCDDTIGQVRCVRAFNCVCVCVCVRARELIFVWLLFVLPLPGLRKIVVNLVVIFAWHLVACFYFSWIHHLLPIAITLQTEFIPVVHSGWSLVSTTRTEMSCWLFVNFPSPRICLIVFTFQHFGGIRVKSSVEFTPKLIMFSVRGSSCHP
jgi:hypothetical protein